MAVTRAVRAKEAAPGVPAGDLLGQTPTAAATEMLPGAPLVDVAEDQ